MLQYRLIKFYSENNFFSEYWTYFDVVPIQVHQRVIVFAYLSDRRVDVRLVRGIVWKNFWLTRLCYPVPTHADRLPRVEQGSVILVLVHHRVETENSCRKIHMGYNLE